MRLVQVKYNMASFKISILVHYKTPTYTLWEGPIKIKINSQTHPGDCILRFSINEVIII